MGMENTIVFITGGSLGIGKATALLLAKQGAKLALTYYKDKEEGEAVAQQCKEAGAPDVVLAHLNLSDVKSIETAVETVQKHFGHIDFLINNAGVVVWKPLKEQTIEEIQNQITINLTGLMIMTQKTLPYIKKGIVNVASGAGKSGYPTLAPYCGTKFGVRGFTQALAMEHKDLLILAVNPGMTKTRMTNFEGRPPEQVAEVIMKSIDGTYAVTSGGDVDVWEKFPKNEEWDGEE